MDRVIFIVSSIINILFILLIIIYYNKVKRCLNFRAARRVKRQNDQAIKEIEELKHQKEQLNNEIESLDNTIKDKNNILNHNLLELEQNYVTVKQRQLESLDNELKQIKVNKEMQMSRDIEEWAKGAQELENINYEQLHAIHERDIINVQNKLHEYYLILDDYQTAQDAINKDIQRAKQKEADRDFYKINLSSECKEDMNLLNTVRFQLHEPKFLNKVIYDCYISKPLIEMIRRVAPGNTKTGIYKITSLTTKEIYVGQSVDIQARWKGHVKAACGLEGVAESVFQRALVKQGIDNFTFEILEECEKESLHDREKYWIEFYKSDKYGFNQRKG